MGKRLPPPTPVPPAPCAPGRGTPGPPLFVFPSTGYYPLTLFVICPFVYDESPLFMWRLWPILLGGQKKTTKTTKRRTKTKTKRHTRPNPSKCSKM